MKKIIIKLLAFLALFTLLQALVAYTTMPAQIKDISKMLKNPVDVVYFGDSIIDFELEKEADKESIVDKVKKLGDGYTVCGIYHAAYNMDIYYSFAKYISGSARKPKALVIPINMATFSPEWMRPQFQFDTERSILENNNIFYDIFYKPISIFKKESMTTRDYMNLGVYNGEKLLGRVKDFDNSSFSAFSRENFRKKVILRYMYRLDANEWKARSLLKILDLYKGSKVKLIFYISPVDHETCSEYAGPDFKERMDYNRGFLKTMIVSRGASFIDMAYSLPKGDFGWSENSMYVNEHMDSRGRQLVAGKVDREIRKALGMGM